MPRRRRANEVLHVCGTAGALCQVARPPIQPSRAAPIGAASRDLSRDLPPLAIVHMHTMAPATALHRQQSPSTYNRRVSPSPPATACKCARVPPLGRPTRSKSFLLPPPHVRASLTQYVAPLYNSAPRNSERQRPDSASLSYTRRSAPSPFFIASP